MSDVICTVDGCEKRIKCKRMCHYHYHKALYPTHAARGELRKNEEIDYNDFWEFVKKELNIKA